MKKYLIIVSLGFATLLSACGSTPEQKKDAGDSTKNHKIAKQYTCTMHPDVIKDKPGTCPKCGMDLVEKDK